MAALLSVGIFLQSIVGKRVSNKFAAKVPKLQSSFTLNSSIAFGRFLRESHLKQNYNNMSNTYIYRIQKNH